MSFLTWENETINQYRRYKNYQDIIKRITAFVVKKSLTSPIHNAAWLCPVRFGAGRLPDYNLWHLKPNAVPNKHLWPLLLTSQRAHAGDVS